MSQSTSNKEPSKKIREWLEKQGYALEMRVAQAFSNAGFKVSISQYYVDLNSKKLREIDVVASISEEFGNISVSVDVFIECKYAPRSWVVFTAQKGLGPFGYFSRILQGKFDVFRWESRPTLQARLISRMLSSLGTNRIKELEPFLVPQSVGYRVIESLKTEGPDSAYSALLQVTNSVQAYDMKAEKEYGRILDDLERQGYGVGSYDDLYLFSGISIPVIFIRGKLFECYLDAKGAIELINVDESIVMMSSKDITDTSGIGNSVEGFVRIVTEDLLDEFAQKMFVAAKSLLAQDAAIKSVWQNERNRFPQTPDENEIPF